MGTRAQPSKGTLNKKGGDATPFLDTPKRWLPPAPSLRKKGHAILINCTAGPVTVTMNGNSLEKMIAQATTTRWAWGNPTFEQANIPDENGRVLLAVRRDDLRAVCLAWEYEHKTHRLWSAWSEQEKGTGGEWQEIARFPRLEDVRVDERGRWRRLAYDIDEHTPEYRWLCPPRLRALVEERAGN